MLGNIKFGLSWWLSGKESTCQCRICERRGFYSLVGKIPWRRKWQPIPLFLPEKSFGQRSLMGYTPWGRKESDMTEWLSTMLSLPGESGFLLHPVSIVIQSRRESLFDAPESLASLTTYSSPLWLTLILFWTVRAHSPGWEPSIGSSGWLEFNNVVFIVFILEISSLYGKGYCFCFI